MRKSLIALATLGTIAGAAYADGPTDTSVTLYGIIDTGITYTTNQATGPGVNDGHNAWQMTNGNLYNNRWGLKGTENLGGGMNAVFDLENGFFLSNGRFAQGGQEFGRQAYVGLSNAYGTLTFGRQYDSLSDFLGVYASSNDWATGFGAHFGDVDNLNQAARLNNAIKFVSPTYAGLSFGGVFALGNHAGAFQQDRAWSVAAAYTFGPVSFSGAYLNIHNPLAVNAAGLFSGGAYAPLTGNYEGSFNADYVGLQNASSEKVYGAGASYTFGAATMNLVYTRTRFDNSSYFVTAATPNATTGVRLDNYEVNGKYNLTPALTVGAAYIFTDGKVSSLDRSPKFHQVNLGTNYALSKRTSIYLVGVYQHAAGDGIVPTGTPGEYAAIASIPNLSDSGSNQQLAVTIGVKHAF